jgi:hypothetical protein
VLRAGLIVLLTWSGLGGCGGSFSGNGPDGTGSNGGEAGASSSSSGASCTYDGETYEDGESFPDRDGCNNCHCDDGDVGCTLLGCLDPCEGFASDYAAALDEAKSCDPAAPDSCSELIAEGLVCGCDAFVNPANAEAIAAAQTAQQAYAEAQCGGDVLCGPCAPAVSAYCSAEGRCETTHDTGQGIACKVGGIVYPSGAGNIPDPVSCNTCECLDGQLACTEIGCPKPCPDGSDYGTQCAECGPTDACLVVEHGCLPVCMDSCVQGSCNDGLCRFFCG